MNKNIILAAVILAAGKGERIQNYSKTAKPFMMIGSKPLICYVIDNLIAVGIRKIYIVKYNEHCFESIVRRYKTQDIIFKFIEDKRQLGSLYTLSLVEKIEEENFICTDCDIISSEREFVQMIQSGITTFFSANIDGVIAKIESPSAVDPNMLFIRNNRAKAFRKEGIENGIRGGYVYIFSKNIFPFCKTLLDNNCYSMSVFLDFIMRKMEIGVMSIKDMWDIDTEEDIYYTNDKLQRKIK